MLKIEFEEISGSKVEDMDYRLIEHIYTYFDPAMDKFQFCDLYKVGGMALMLSMKPQADRNKELEMLQSRQKQIKAELQQFMEKMFALHDEEQRIAGRLNELEMQY